MLTSKAQSGPCRGIFGLECPQTSWQIQLYQILQTPIPGERIN